MARRRSPEPVHRPGRAGTLTGYVRDGCGCDRCRTYYLRYQTWWRAHRLGRKHVGCPTCSCPLPEHPDRATGTGNDNDNQEKS